MRPEMIITPEWMGRSDSALRSRARKKNPKPKLNKNPPKQKKQTERTAIYSIISILSYIYLHFKLWFFCG